MLELRPITEPDFQTIVDWNAGTDEDFLYQWAGRRTYRYPLSVEQVKASCTQAYSQTFILWENGRAVGTLSLDRTSPNIRCAHFCRFLLADETRGHGLGRLALQELIRLAFYELGLQRLTLRVFCFNIAAIRCYERCGFTVKEYHREPDAKWNAYTMELQK